MSDLWPTYLATLATAAACAALSPIVVAKRWAYISEGVGHGTYGGAGVVWLAAALLPGVAMLHEYATVAVAAAVAALVVAGVVGSLHRRARRTGLGFDTAVAVVLTASLALGFLARQVYIGRYGAAPVGADALLFGGGRLSPAAGVVAALAALPAVAAVVLLPRQILAWAFDEQAAELAGVRTGAVHLTLLLLVAATVAAGAHLLGAVLVTALLVVPGAAANRLATGLGQTWAWCAIVAAAAAAAGLATTTLYPAVPLGPPTVVVLVAIFALSLLRQ